MYMIAKEVAKLNLTFCVLQEVRHRNVGSKIIELNTGEKFQFYWCGQKKRRDFGVGILVRIDPRIHISEPDFNTPRVMGINLNIHSFKLRVIIGYSPTNVEENLHKKEEFYRNLKKASNDIGKHRKIIFAGDFNAETAVVLEKTNYNGKTIVDDNICNDNGQRLKSFCRAKNLCFPQSYFSHPLELRYTWYSCDGKTKKVLDYVLTGSFVQQYITDCVVYPDFKADSDHRLLVTSLNTPRNKFSRWKPKEKKSTKPINLDALNKTETKSAFIKRTERYFLHSKKINSTPSEISDNLIDAF